MKICLLSYRGNPYCGGQGIYIAYLARELIRTGHEVHIIVGPPYPEAIEGAIVHKIDNHNYFNNRKHYIKPEKPFASLSLLNLYEFIAAKCGIFPEMETFSVRAFIKLKQLVKEHNFDIIHDNQCLGYGFALIKQLGVPFVSTIHHPLTIDRSTWFEYPSSFWLKMKRILYYPLVMQKKMANIMDRVITVSEDSAREIHKAFKVPLNRIDVVYNGMDSTLFYPRKGSSKKKESLIFVGNVEDRKKGIIYLLKALTLTKNKPVLTIVDGGAPNRSFVPGWIKKFGLENRVTLTGKITLDQLIDLYAQTSIAVSPSLYEGFGFPVAEAMACELPVITTTAGALPEVAGNHLETAYIVPPRDAKALAEAIDSLIDNDDLRKTMGKAARQRVLDLFTWEDSVNNVVSVYEHAIQQYNQKKQINLGEIRVIQGVDS